MNRRDGRFLLREKRIQKTLNSLPKNIPVMCITNAKFAKKARIGRATFRRHYKDVEEAFYIQRREILQEFRVEAKQYHGCAAKNIFRFILIFIYQHKEFFQNDLFHCDCLVINKIFRAFQIEICAQKHIDLENFDFYIYKITFFLKKWGKINFNVNNIPKILKNLLEITISK